MDEWATWERGGVHAVVSGRPSNDLRVPGGGRTCHALACTTGWEIVSARGEGGGETATMRRAEVAKCLSVYRG